MSVPSRSWIDGSIATTGSLYLLGEETTQTDVGFEQSWSREDDPHTVRL